jgi:cbb3-type cytochrome oxidase cytochrome c subunit
MKGLAPLFLGIFGTFAFSWVGLTVIPNWQIGHLNPQSDEEGTDIYPMPQSGMVQQGARVYAANGCIYCHSEQVRAEYAGADIERKWGDRRSAPRDYIFERPVFLGKMRMGQDLTNIGARAPAEQESPSPAQGEPGSSPPPPAASPSPTGSPGPATSPATQGAAPSSGAVASTKEASPPPQGAAASTPTPAGSPTSAGSPATVPAASPGSPAPKAPTSPAPPASLSPAAGVAAGASPAASPSPTPPWPVQTTGFPPMYSAAWHHVHLYSPRSINFDSNMPSYRFLYETRRISDARSSDALRLTGSDAPPEGWEIVPTYDAKCLVAYMMSLNQSHPLKDVRSAGAAVAASPAASPAPGGQPPK